MANPVLEIFLVQLEDTTLSVVRELVAHLGQIGRNEGVTAEEHTHGSLRVTLGNGFEARNPLGTTIPDLDVAQARLRLGHLHHAVQVDLAEVGADFLDFGVLAGNTPEPDIVVHIQFLAAATVLGRRGDENVELKVLGGHVLRVVRAHVDELILRVFQHANQPPERVNVVVVAHPEEISVIRITLTNEVLPSVEDDGFQ